MQIREISAEEFKQMQLEKVPYFLLDVREPQEFEKNNMGGYLIPLGELPGRLGELNKADNIVVHCHLGGRSARAVAFLLGQGFERVSNLKGGIEGWDGLK